MLLRVKLLAALIAFLPAAATASEGDAEDAPATPEAEAATGRFQASWPLPPWAELKAGYAAVVRRQGVRVPTDPPAHADGGEHTYEVYVPSDYAPGRPFGLFVWISASPESRVPEQWMKVLDAQHLICVAPNDIGNDRDMIWRTYMALETVRQAKARYTIDDERVYVSGISGGGRIASHAALLGADTFTGGFYVVGCNFWKPVSTGEGKRMYAGFWRTPDPRLLKRARATNRYVLLTGSDDFNRGNTKSVYDGYVKDKFAHATYLEVPGMGHALPDASWFERGIAALDAPLTLPEELFEQAAGHAKRKQLGDACLAYARAAVRGAGEPFAAEAAEKAEALRVGYAAQVERVRGFIDDRKFEKAVAENAVLKRQYGPMAAEQVKAFVEAIKLAKAKR